MPIINRATVLRNAERFKKLKGTSIVSNTFNQRGVKRTSFLHEWCISRTPFNKTDSRFNFKISKCISDLVLERKHGVRVLDWGCGAGVGASQLSNRYKKQFVKVLAYGADFYPEWIKIAKKGRVEFLQSSLMGLEKYLKKHPVDLIYSDTALIHLCKAGILEKHLVALKSGLTAGGKIFITPITQVMLDKKTFVKNMHKAGFIVELNFDSATVILTKPSAL